MITNRRGSDSDERRRRGQRQDEIDARGTLVTPGFVDIHADYDA